MSKKRLSTAVSAPGFPIISVRDAAEKIIEMAQDEASDLIVLGAQHKRFSDTTMIGTTTVRVTRHAPRPVLTVIRK